MLKETIIFVDNESKQQGYKSECTWKHFKNGAMHTNFRSKKYVNHLAIQNVQRNCNGHDRKSTLDYSPAKTTYTRHVRWVQMYVYYLPITFQWFNWGSDRAADCKAFHFKSGIDFSQMRTRDILGSSAKPYLRNIFHLPSVKLYSERVSVACTQALMWTQPTSLTNTAAHSRYNFSIPKTSTLWRYQPFDKVVLNQQMCSAVIAYKNSQHRSHMSILMFQCH